MSWLSGWNKRKKVTITGGASGAQTDFQLKLTIPYVSSMQNDFNDLRFTQADGQTLINAWLQEKTDGVTANVWVNLPSTPANSVTQDYYMYYGNSGASSDWAGSNTFPTLFDDFEDGDVSDWTVESGSTFVASTTQVKSGTYSGKEYGQGGKGVQAYKTFTNQTSKFVIEFDVFPEIETDNHLYVMIEKTGGSDSNSIQFDMRAASPDWRYLNGGINVFIYPATQTWYHWEILVDPPNDQFSLWSNDVSKVTNGGTTGDITTGCSAIGLASLWATTHGVYIDNLFIRKYAAGPPTYLFDSEESETISIMVYQGKYNTYKFNSTLYFEEDALNHGPTLMMIMT